MACSASNYEPFKNTGLKKVGNKTPSKNSEKKKKLIGLQLIELLDYRKTKKCPSTLVTTLRVVFGCFDDKSVNDESKLNNVNETYFRFIK